MSDNVFYKLDRPGRKLTYLIPETAPFHAVLSLKGLSKEREVEEAQRQGKVIFPVQMHSTRILDGINALCMPQREEGDGILLSAESRKSGILQFADCIPVLVFCPLAEPWMLMLHSGFRGTLENIIHAGLSKAREHFPESDLSRCHAWIGPGIGSCCYDRTLDDPLSQKALELFGEENYTCCGSKLFLDLKGEIMRQLIQEGILKEQIHTIPFCTSCEKDLFYSYRQGDLQKRMVLMVKPLGFPESTRL